LPADISGLNVILAIRRREQQEFAYLAGLKSPLLFVADTKTNKVIDKIGPFSASIRPFTVNGSQTFCFVNVNELLGFEMGDLKTGKKLHRVEVPDSKR